MPLKLCFRARAALFAPAALALVLFASGRVVSASGQGSPQPPVSPAPQIPVSTSTAGGPTVQLSADEAELVPVLEVDRLVVHNHLPMRKMNRTVRGVYSRSRRC